MPQGGGAAAGHSQMGAGGAANVFSGTDTYSPELRQIMKYVESHQH